MRTAVVAAALARLIALPAFADVVEAGATGFQVKSSVVVKAPARDVDRAMTQIGRWWSKDHSYSGDAKNLRLDPRAGGCWCEIWSGGQVEHMRVVYAEPGKTLRFSGALGPLQTTGASGHMVWTLAEKDGATTMTWTYDVGGYSKGGLNTWAGPVDGVLKEAMGRLKTYAETGKAP